MTILTRSSVRTAVLVAATFLASCSVVETAQAQLFGSRTMGQPLSRRPPPAGAAPAALDSAGAVQGDERFLRGNRSRSEFVGPNRGSQQGFVGSDQAIGVGQVRTSVESLREPPDRSAEINRPVAPLAAGAMYYPRLSISQSEMATPSYISAVVGKRDTKLQARLSAAAGTNIQVAQQGNRTVLRGVVASQSMIEKLRILASFEPHIDTLKCELVIAPTFP